MRCDVELGIAPIEVRRDMLVLRKVHELLLKDTKMVSIKVIKQQLKSMI